MMVLSSPSPPLSPPPTQRRRPSPLLFQIQLPVLLLLLLWSLLSAALAFNNNNIASPSTISVGKGTQLLLRQRRGHRQRQNAVPSLTPLYASNSRLRKDVEIPLLDLINYNNNNKEDKNEDKDNYDKDENDFVTPLPSSDFPDQLATPFLYGMQMETPLHKLILEEAISMAETVTVDVTVKSLSTTTSPFSSLSKPIYGHLVWKDTTSDTLVGAIGCTAEILVNAPTNELIAASNFNQSPFEEKLAKLEKSFSEGDDTDNNDNDNDNNNNENNNENKNNNDDNVTPTSNTLLCRGGWRFVVKEVVRSIPYPVVIVDEIQDDADEDDSDMFATVGTTSTSVDDDDDDDDEDDFSHMSTPELIHNTMIHVQSIIGQQLEDANAKTELGPLEKSILEDSGIAGSGSNNNNANNNIINPAVIELAHAEEMSAVWDVFQSSLIDDIEPALRRFAVAIMAAELAHLNNDLRQEILITRNSEERLRIVLRELNEIVGMTQARKMASVITDEVDETEKDLKVGKPTLPKWAKQIKKGTKIDYFWNEEYGWCPGEVAEDPVTINNTIGNNNDDDDEEEEEQLLLTIRFDDGEEHRLPLTAEDKLRWRPQAS